MCDHHVEHAEATRQITNIVNGPSSSTYRHRRRRRLPDESVQYRCRRPIPRRPSRAPFAGQAWLGPSTSFATIVVAMVAGGLGEHRRIPQGQARGQRRDPTIMLNAIATGVVQWMLLKVAVRGPRLECDRHQDHPRVLPAGGWKLIPGATNRVYSSMLLLAIIVGFLLVRAGQDAVRLRPAGDRSVGVRGRGQWVKVQRMVMTSMIASGALAGLVGMPCSSVKTTRMARPSKQAWLRRHRHRPARPQQRDRHRLCRLAVELPRHPEQWPADPGRGSPRTGQHHPGHHLVRHRHRPTKACADPISGSNRPRSPRELAATRGRPVEGAVA